MNETQTHDQLEADIERASKRTLESELAWLLRKLRDGTPAAHHEVAALTQEWLSIPGWDQAAKVRILEKCHLVPAKLRLAAIKANQPPSNGVAENINEIHSLAFNAEQADAFARLLPPGEYYLPGRSTPRGLRTNIRIYPRSEITAACRTSAQLNDSMFAKAFPSEPEIRAAEERLAEASKPPLSPGSRPTVDSIDWPRK